MQKIPHKTKDQSEGAASLKVADEKPSQTDSCSALQQFLDRIPISSIAGIKSSFGLELKAGDSVEDAIHRLYKKDIYGAPIADVVDPNASSIKFSYRHIGFIGFPSMVLWCIEEYEKIRQNSTNNSHEEIRNNSFFSTLDQIPQIGQTKVGELAKPFLWEPIFPIHLTDTLLHALLLLSKHQLHVLPVVQRLDPEVIGLVTQNALVQLLLQSDGLEWFDNIADKALSDLKIGNQEQASYVFGDQTVADALYMLLKNRTSAVAVVDRQSKKLVGSVRNRDVYHLVENDDFFRNRNANLSNYTFALDIHLKWQQFATFYVPRLELEEQRKWQMVAISNQHESDACQKNRKLTVGEFIHSETDKTETNSTNETDNGASLIASSIRLKKSFMPKMDSPLTNKTSDTLKQLMKQMTERNGTCSFLIDDKEQVMGLITLRDVIMQFVPPYVSSSVDGGGFFNLALEQSGCHVKDGTLIRNH